MRFLSVVRVSVTGSVARGAVSKTGTVSYSMSVSVAEGVRTVFETVPGTQVHFF